MRADPDGNFAFSFRDAGQCIHAVAQQVQQHLLDLDGVDINEPGLLRHAELQLDLVVAQLGLNETQRGLDNLANVDPLPPHIALPREIADALEYVVGAFGLTHNLGEPVIQGLELRHARFNFSKACLGISHDRAEGLIELMRKA